MPKYEYKVAEVKPDGFWGMTIKPEAIEAKLNAMALEGWELVNTIDFTAFQSTANVIFIFKREATF